MSDYQKVKLHVSHGPDLHFEGKVLHEYTTQNRAQTKPRWTELRLWETPAGNWIAENVGCSARENEGEIREARVITKTRMELVRSDNGLIPPAYEPTPRSMFEMIDQAMELFQWSTAAKAFAREMGWDVIKRVE